MVNSYGETRILSSLSGYGRTPSTPYRRYQPGGAQKSRRRSTRSRSRTSRRTGRSKARSRRGRRPRKLTARKAFEGDLGFYDTGIPRRSAAYTRRSRIYRRVMGPREVRRQTLLLGRTPMRKRTRIWERPRASRRTTVSRKRYREYMRQSSSTRLRRSRVAKRQRLASFMVPAKRRRHS